MSGHNGYPAQDLGAETGFSDPEIVTEVLHHQEIELSHSLREVETPTGSYLEMAEFEIPSDEATDTHVTLGYTHGTPDSQVRGFFLLAGQSRADYVGAPIDWAIQPERLPLGIGSKVGDTFTIGRKGFERNGEPGATGSRFSKEVTGAFSGPDTSSKHLEFTVTANGINVRDRSTNGTKATYRGPSTA